MGGSSAPKNTTTTSKTELPPWLANQYQDFFSQTNTANNKPYQSYDGTLNAPIQEGQNAAYTNAMAMANGSPYQTDALNALLGGSQNVAAQTSPFAGPNQYLDQVVNNSNRDITDSYMRGAGVGLPTQFSQGGAFGGSAMQQAQDASQQTLGKTLSDNTSNLRYQDYNAQADRWQQGFQNQLAASQNNAQNMLGASSALNGVNALQAQWNGQLASMGQVQQDKVQGDIDQAYNDWYMKNYGYDQQRLSNIGNALNASSGNFASTAITGLNPAYKPRTTGGAVAAVGGGALAGAATGAYIGSTGGPIGAGAGAVIGGGLAAMGYYL